MKWKYCTFLGITVALTLNCAKPIRDIPQSISDEPIAPKLIRRSLPYYPAEARQRGWEGRVGLYIEVSDSGQVQQVRIASTSHYARLDSAAVRYAKSFVFQPATEDRESFPLWVHWTIEYKLDDTSPYFHPLEYAEKIIRLKAQIAQTSDESVEGLQGEMLMLHEKFAAFTRRYPDLNFIPDIKASINPEILEQWAPYWSFWSLSFLVFHDFIEAFPGSQLKVKASEALLENLYLDLAPILAQPITQQKNQELRQELFRAVQYFLVNNYPSHDNIKLKRLIEKQCGG